MENLGNYIQRQTKVPDLKFTGNFIGLVEKKGREQKLVGIGKNWVKDFPMLV